MPKLRSGYLSPEEQKEKEKKKRKRLIFSIIGIVVFGLLSGILVFSFSQPRGWDVAIFSVMVVAGLVWYLVLGIFDAHKGNS
jgi:thiamine transporter ThiT